MDLIRFMKQFNILYDYISIHTNFFKTLKLVLVQLVATGSHKISN